MASERGSTVNESAAGDMGPPRTCACYLPQKATGTRLAALSEGRQYSRSASRSTDQIGDGVTDLRRRTGHVPSCAQVRSHSLFDPARIVHAPDVLQEHRDGQDRCGRVGLALPCDIGRRTVNPVSYTHLTL